MAFHCFAPITRQFVNCAVTVNIRIDKVFFCLSFDCISSPVRIDGIFRDELDVFLKEAHHFYGEGKNSQSVYPPMGEKSPSLYPFDSQEKDQQQQKSLFHH